MNSIKRVFEILTIQQKKQFKILLFFVFVGMLFEIGGLGVFIPALYLILDENFDLSKYSLFLNNYGIGLTQSGIQKLIIFSLVIFQFVKLCFMIFLTYSQQRFVGGLSKDLNERLLSGYLMSPYKFHLDNNSSNLINNIQGELSHFISVVQAFLGLILEFLTIFGFLILLVYIDFKSTLGVLLILLLSSWIFQKYSKERLLKFGKIRTDNLHFAIKNLSNTLISIKEVKISGKEKYFLNNYKKYNQATIDALSKKETLLYIPKYYLEFISFTAFSFLILFILYTQQSTQTILPILGIYATAAFRILPSVNRILNSLQLVKFSEATIDKLYIEFKSLDFNSLEAKENETYNSSQFNEKIDFSDITFRYSSDSHAIFHRTNLEIKKNECLGIIGKSGSGKSTFVNIVLGLLDIESGAVKIDGLTLTKNTNGWFSNVGYVPQNICLIDDSISKNIAFGLEESEIDYERLNVVCVQARILDFINQLPNKFNTEVGERGVRISGGQLQRIGIARALYHNPLLLIFDESTSALDSRTETEFIECVNSLKGDKTIIFITHRESTLSICDRVVSLENGKFIEKELNEIKSN
uniref:ATP-binding cassette domain-containing protein n=1 Tax=Flavobacterium sp. TaxID=239 RepID=UPI00404A43C1